MPAQPKTRDEKMLEGYNFSDFATCSGCGADIEWWITPKGAKMPVNLMQTGNHLFIAHFATCTQAARFRKGKK